MDHHDGLMMGMFWGGLLVAAVPILLTLGIGIFVLKRYLESDGPGTPDRASGPVDPGARTEGG
jgi:hypothetical protein